MGVMNQSTRRREKSTSSSLEEGEGPKDRGPSKRRSEGITADAHRKVPLRTKEGKGISAISRITTI